MGFDQIHVELQDHMGTDAAVAHAAWTSSLDLDRKELKTPEDIERLCRRVVLDGHRTPVESVVLRFWIRLPIFSDRQHMTHRIATHNGLSGRYRTMPDDWYHLPQDVLNILGRAGHSDINEGYDDVCQWANHMYRTHLEHLRAAEKGGAITNGEYKRCREVLRGMLPQAGMTERVTVMNLGALANYQVLRNSSHAQPEICYIAKLMADLVRQKGIAPVTVGALVEKGWIIGPEPTMEVQHLWAQQFLDTLGMAA